MAANKNDAQKRMLTGNHSAAYGAKLARAEVIPVYPITPQTGAMEKMIELIEGAELDAEYLPMESQHSVMAAAIAAEATGARVFTASSSQGVAYMHENLFVASGLRLPIGTQTAPHPFVLLSGTVFSIRDSRAQRCPRLGSPCATCSNSRTLASRSRG